MNILAFGIVREIFGGPEIAIDIKEGEDIDALKKVLEKKYPKLNELGSYMIAVNNEYAKPADIIHKNDELAIIPPVSGG